MKFLFFIWFVFVRKFVIASSPQHSHEASDSWIEQFNEIGRSMPSSYVPGDDATPGDLALAEFATNLECLEAEFFLYAALGVGLSRVNPTLTTGPESIGVQRANLDPFVRDLVAQFALQEVGHLRAIRDSLKVSSIVKPQLDLSIGVWSKIVNRAMGETLEPPFNPYANSLNFMLASYMVPYVGLNGYVGANPLLVGSSAKRLVAGLLGVESGQDALIRGYLYSRKNRRVEPYRYTVAEMTDKLSALRRDLDSATEIDDEGVVVPRALGAEGSIHGNILAADQYSLSFARTPQQILEIVYGTGRADCPGGFYPCGGVGKIAESSRLGSHPDCPPPS